MPQKVKLQFIELLPLENPARSRWLTKFKPPNGCLLIVTPAWLPTVMPGVLSISGVDNWGITPGTQAFSKIKSAFFTNFLSSAKIFSEYIEKLQKFSFLD